MKKPRVFYGYWMVIAGLLSLIVYSGTGWYAFAVLNTPIGEEFGWNRGAVMSAFSVLFIVQGLAGPFIGRLSDRYGPRRIICGASIITGSGFALLSLTQHLWHFYCP